MRRTTMTRRSALLLLSIGSVTSLVGCGGGASGAAASRATKTRVKATASRLFVHGALYGRIMVPLVPPRPAGAGGAPTGIVPLDAANGGQSAGPVPMMGAFVRNRIAGAAHRSRQVSPGDPGPIPVDPPGFRPDFYYDYFLGLWVRTTNSASEFRCDFFEDEAQTSPAGHMLSTLPTDWSAFPQVFASDYAYTAGALKGAHGTYRTQNEADGSGLSTYENVSSDGGKDKGSSRWSAAGDWTWTSRNDAADGSWSEFAGTFRRDGSGGTRVASSDGFEAIYDYHADGSGHGTVQGNEPGLPATVDWDPYGNVTVRYADGSIETFNWWSLVFLPVEPVAGGGGSTGVGTVGASTTP